MREKDGKKAKAEALVQAEKDEKERLEKEEHDAFVQKEKEEKEATEREEAAER